MSQVDLSGDADEEPPLANSGSASLPSAALCSVFGHARSLSLSLLPLPPPPPPVPRYFPFAERPAQDRGMDQQMQLLRQTEASRPAAFEVLSSSQNWSYPYYI